MRRRVAIAVLACWPAMAGAQEFRYRDWVGSKLPNDKEQGCAMGLDFRREAGFLAYANAKGEFRIGFSNPERKLEQGKEEIAAVTFDDGPPILLKGSAVGPTTLLFEPIDLPEEGGLEPLVESARRIKMTVGGQSIGVRLSGSSRALKMLKDCAAKPEGGERQPARGEPGRGAGPQAGTRSVDFSFLRQGMDVAEANRKLLDAGWQAAGAPPGAGGAGEDPAFKTLRDRGVSAQSCTSNPKDCVVDYADAFGNVLKVTAAVDAEAKVKSWRLNPPERLQDAGGGPNDR